GMRPQMMVAKSFDRFVGFGHDANREFAYAISDASIKDGTFLLEPVYNFERLSDYESEAQYRTAQLGTNGFVQLIVQKDANSPALYLHSGSSAYPNKKARIFATFDGISFRKVFEEDGSKIGFGAKMLFNDDNIYLVSELEASDSRNAGFFRVMEK